MGHGEGRGRVWKMKQMALVSREVGSWEVRQVQFWHLISHQPVRFL